MKLNYLLVFSILKFSNSFSNFFYRYNPSQIVEELNPLIEYSVTQINLHKYGSLNQKHWLSINRNLWKSVKYTKLRGEKCLYLGWDYESNKNTIESPKIYIFLDIESENILVITHIIQNPCFENNIDIQLFKKHLIEFTDNIGIYLDISKLKNFEDKRWYLDFVHTRS
tara:strand:+ start:6171 stop:6674 length:504 start_codon:yes stop_codon:yes gene_type:complete